MYWCKKHFTEFKHAQICVFIKSQWDRPQYREIFSLNFLQRVFVMSDVVKREKGEKCKENEFYGGAQLKYVLHYI